VDEPPIFTCSKCGSEHPSTYRDDAITRPLPPTEECDKLRNSWLASISRLEGATDENREKLEAAEIRYSVAYHSKCCRTNVWAVPETLTSHRGGDKVWRLYCASCAPPKKVKKTTILLPSGVTGEEEEPATP
jgi:hypothetical protein